MSSSDRYERKYTTHLDADVLRALILTHPGMFHEIFYLRRVVSLYFDTPEYQLFQDNLIGSPTRIKVRLRWYCKPDAPPWQIPDAINLELKIRKGDIMQKRTIPLKCSFTDADIRDQEVQEYLTDLTQFAMQSSFSEARLLKSVLLNTYVRAYFYSDFHNVRITLDDKLEFYSISKPHSNSLSSIMARRVFEVKYGVENDVRMGEIMRYFPLTISKSSKYMMGMQLVTPVIT